MAFNKIGFHFGSQASAQGWGDYVRRLDAAGIPAVLMSMAGEGFGDIAACWDKGSIVPHVVCIRYGGVQGNHDVPPYGADPYQAAVEWWGWYKPRIGPDAFKYRDRIVLKMGNELDKNQSEWLARFYLALYDVLQSDPDGPWRMAAFNFAAGEPEPVHWRGPMVKEFLTVAAADPFHLAIGLHEYSYQDILNIGNLSMIGRFTDLFKACDEMGIKRPSVYIHEFGWRQDTLPGVGEAMAQIPWAAELYAAHPEVKGAGIWTLQGAGSYGNINLLTQQLIAPITEYSLAARFPDPEEPTEPEPPIPPDPPPPPGGNMDCDPRVPYAREYYVLPQDATMARYLEVAQQAYAGRKTLAFSYDDAGHAPGVSSNTAVLYDIPADKQQLFVDWYAAHYPATQVIFAGDDGGQKPPDPEPGNPLDGLELGRLFTVPYTLTSPFNAARDYGLHEGVDYDVLGANPNNKEMVLCTYDGIVERSLDSTGGYGTYVRVVHERNGRQFFTRYCHLDTRVVQVGQAIKAGQPVGEIGTTGNVTGEHVHFNLEVPGFGLSGYVVADVVDPVPYLPKPLVQLPTPIGPCRLGLHASADPGDLYGREVEYDEFATLFPKVIKVLSATSETAVRRLANGNPGAEWIIRAFLQWGGRSVTPQQFFDWTKEDTLRAVNALRSLGIGDAHIHIELHNEPNLALEGWGTSWIDGTGFNVWLLDVLQKYRGILPGVRFLYPGLSPGGAIAGTRYDSSNFLQQSMTAAKACDGVGIHAYWSDPFPMQQAYDHIDRHVQLFGSKPLWITEASRNDRPATKPATVYAAEYFTFCETLKKRPSVQGVTFFVASASDSYFAPECWVVNGQSRGIAAEIKRLQGR